MLVVVVRAYGRSFMMFRTHVPMFCWVFALLVHFVVSILFQ